MPDLLHVQVAVDFGDILIAPSARVLSENSVGLLQSVNVDGSLATFSRLPPELRDLAAGQILVFGVTSTTPFGLLKRVMRVRPFPDRVEVELAQASLDEVIQGGTIGFSTPLSPPSTPRSLRLGAAAAALGNEQGFSVAIRDLVLLGDSNNGVKLNGEIFLNPVLDFSAHFCSLFCLDSLVWDVGISESLDLRLDATIGASATKAVQIADFQFAPIIVWVGFVPVVFVPTLSVDAGIKGSVSAGLQAELSQQAQFVVGQKYQNGVWTGISNSSVSSTGAVVPTVGGKARAFTGPRVNLLVYGVVGPNMRADAYSEFDADIFSNPSWQLWAGLEAGAGVRIEIMSRTLAQVDSPVLVSYRFLLAQAQAQPNVVFDNFVGNVVNPHAAYFIFDRFFGIADTDIAGSFMPSSEVRLDRIELPLSLPGNVGTPAIVDVWLMADASGSPGAILESFSTTFPAPSFSIIGFTSAVRPLLIQGVQYWLGASVRTTNPNGTVVWWYISPTGLGLTSNTVNGSWVSFLGSQPAFRVFGTP